MRCPRTKPSSRRAGKCSCRTHWSASSASSRDTRVEFFETVDGEVFFHAIVGTTQGWKGMFGAPARRPPISIREMDEGIADYLSEKHERIKRQSGKPRAVRSSKRPA